MTFASVVLNEHYIYSKGHFLDGGFVCLSSYCGALPQGEQFIDFEFTSKHVEW